MTAIVHSEPPSLDRRRLMGDDSGTVLLLFPAGVLIVLILAAITSDRALMHMARRNLLDLAATAANDAATYGMDRPHYRTTGQYRLDPARAATAVARVIRLNGSNRLYEINKASGPDLICTPSSPQDACVIRVQVSAEVPWVFGRAFPGSNDVPITMTGTVTVRDSQ